MKHLLKIFIIMILINQLQAQTLKISQVKNFEHQLDDVMELIDTNEVKLKLIEVEKQFQIESSEINKVRLGIIYHETALNLSFFPKTEFKGYAKKSYDVLTELYTSKSTTKELMPFISSYRASSLSLISAETKKLGLLRHAFVLFKEANELYSDASYLPAFLRGSVAENLPWYFYRKRKAAKNDFQTIIAKQEKNTDYANWKIMSFTYWAWANQHQSKKHTTQAILYCDKAISIDPDHIAGRKKAEDLKIKLMRK